MNPSAPFCDADTLATWLFNWVAGCLMLAILTIILSNALSTRKEIKARQQRFEEEQIKAKIILNEIIHVQTLAKQQYEEANSEHEKAKALYAYDKIEECLRKFKIIKVKE